MDVSQVFPAFPPGQEIAILVLGEFLFGVFYNWLVDLAHKAKIYDPLVAVSVALGVAVSVVIPTGLFWKDTLAAWQWSIVMLISFIGSGSPMIYGSLRRMSKQNHKRMRITGTAARIRDEAIMDLKLVVERIDDADCVRDVYQVIGALKNI